MNRFRACVLAVGTEVTEGQIVNSNTAWVSHELAHFGFEVVLHLAVPDEHERILEALQFSERVAQYIFITGGLGPTSDDITRSVVADWAQKPLQLDEKSWQEIQAKLRSRGARILEVQREQARFPAGSQIIKNSVGTANGFYLQKNLVHIWVMPGPPREVESVWKNGVAGDLEDVIPEGERMQLFTWRCVGVPESELADLVERAIDGSELKVGYRLIAPYVEVKIWCRTFELQRWQNWFEKLENAIGQFVVARQDEDLARAFCERLAAIASQTAVCVSDGATDGILMERLGPLLRQQSQDTPHLRIETNFSRAQDVDESAVRQFLELATENLTFVTLGFNTQGEWIAGLRQGSRILVKKWPAVIRRSWWTERGRRVVAELALQYWLQNLEVCS